MTPLLASLLPPPASTSAEMVDNLFLFIFWVSAFFFAVVVGGLTYLVVRYRRRKVRPGLTPGISHNTAIELVWSIIPAILVFIIFFWGFHVYMRLAVAPGDAIEVRVTAKQWSWLFTYPGGQLSDHLVVPVNRPVKLVMSSDDVIHSLFIPDFRVKMDVLPYRYTSLWFEATDEGRYDLYCTEFCGDEHSSMVSSVQVKSQAEYEAWLAAQEALGVSGEALYKTLGCNVCHSLDGTAKIGPSWKGIYGETHTMADGSTVDVDDNYLRESILEPMAKIRQGYPPTMPPQKLTGEQVDALIDYIKSLQE